MQLTAPLLSYFINVGGFFEGLADSSGEILPFWASQVDEVELWTL